MWIKYKHNRADNGRNRSSADLTRKTNGIIIYVLMKHVNHSTVISVGINSIHEANKDKSKICGKG